MSLDQPKEFFSHLSVHDLTLVAAALGAIILVVLAFKTGEFFIKLVFLLIALVCSRATTGRLPINEKRHSEASRPDAAGANRFLVGARRTVLATKLNQ